VRLLETRDEHLPEPTRRVDGVSGFVHHAKAAEACPDCLANDRVMFGCETCGGRGVVEVYRARDPYSESKSPAKYGLDGSRHDAAHERDRKIEMLGRQLRPALPEEAMLEEANRTGYAWENARARMWKRYDYEALDLALDELRVHDPVAYRALHAVYVYVWLREKDDDGNLLPPVGSAAAACERALAFLSPRLAAFEFARGRKLRAPGIEQAPTTRITGPMRPEAGAAAKRTRDEAMRAAAANGATVDELRAQFSVSKSTVYAVVNQRDAA
jgi:hypothetical protein